MGSSLFDEKDFLACCGSTKFAEEMVSAGPFSTHQDAIHAARHIWFNKVDVNGWLEAFAAHPQIGQTPSQNHTTPTFAQWSKGEQSTALTTANESTLQELFEWNARYREKFGFVFLICASGRSAAEILAELKIRYQNRPIIEFEIAAQEQMKITELRLSKLFSDKADTAPTIKPLSTTNIATKAEDRVNIIGAHLTAATGAKPAHIPKRTRPPITTHVLDTSRGCPASDIEVRLEMWKDNLARPQFGEADIGGWILLGSSATDKDGRSGQLMNMVEALVPGVYRMSFNTGKYNPDGFFPYVSIVFEIKESQKWDHFHVPLLLSPFSLSTYRGS
ncbi:uric acid degradation bifunctional protein TTL isoform X2 [Lycium barbarum]|uniref:uric acid degradation bifunctional protein TTL isoform X2 n=1 Tax=Lycium barbarum TaxID=112863 RepID=UPI00293EC4FD|nr:uric acid degradation bifunctional protein TTL isoform X2 [Lycium barbarum]